MKGFFANSYLRIPLLLLVLPFFFFILALISLLCSNGVVTEYITNIFGIEFSIYGFWGVVLAQIIGYFPIGYMLVESTFQSMNADLEYAAQDLGANQWKTITGITLPLA